MRLTSNQATLSTSFYYRLGISLTISILLCLYLPRFLTVGTFTDGPTYAALARNMAVGYGSWWAPRYGEVDSFWLEGVRGDSFYEHPPLMLIIESFFFRSLGDHWWVEELFCALIGVLFLWLLGLNWRLLFPTSPLNRFSWLPILFVCLLPVIRFCITSNHLDSLLLVWVQFSFYQLCRLILRGRISGLYWAAFGIFLGFLTKGPFALFLLATPALYYIARPGGPYPVGRACSQTALLTVVVALLIGALFTYSPARSFFNHYFNQQIIRALQGTRSDFSESSLTGWGRFFVLVTLVKNLLPMGIVSGVSLAWTRWRLKRPLTFWTGNQHILLWLVLIGLSGILPIMVSPKQNAYYIASGVPFLGIVIAFVFAGCLTEWLTARSTKPTFFIQLISLSTPILISLGLTILFIRNNVLTGTEPHFRRGIHEILALKQIPKGTVVAVKDKELITKAWGLNMSLQRFGRITLTMDTTLTPYRLSLIKQSQLYTPDFYPVEQVPSFGIQFWLPKAKHQPAIATNRISAH
ncbi:ArnT family glycosyltransferase [Spirosoma aerolatum]|uniref:ArnT family glycosyltransferase n=1 Tax=Spirosoma aerolatum TaxID=1211326 RepID=UPI0009ABBF3D|nr:glycosyltransferase family 39 protein [Spirosoma aerolatum]